MPQLSYLPRHERLRHPGWVKERPFIVEVKARPGSRWTLYWRTKTERGARQHASHALSNGWVVDARVGEAR